ncbi:putative iron-regulated membrane protein [Anoxybacillus calidus]|uniref:Putative iron-regulated membrane protein n=1 Tax=[Anoxybacillus] calidus TaxID=575178 RepID=A0A7V9YX21_9BACL|nr:PepSY domain-containing protein [Anoxybacillus calidus]MBA2870022.1 putative iron-regulated membrane protein [Anoxybacillus calidus]
MESSYTNNGTAMKESIYKDMYKAMWRWHFYAGIIFAPFLIMLAITGAIYLFKPQIESFLYKDYYYIEQGKHELSPSELVKKVVDHYPNATITRYRPSDAPNRSTEVGIVQDSEAYTVFINPYNGQLLGKLKDQSEFMNVIVKIHGELMTGTIGDRLVELAACWAVILLVTGLYLWWPRGNSLYGILKIRFKQGKRIMWKDIHSMLGIWLSVFILLLIVTGLPWAEFIGDKINRIATATQSGYPSGLWDDIPESVVPTKSVAKVPWAAKNMPVPQSKQNGTSTISLEQVIDIAKERNVYPGFEVNFPEGEKGVYTVSVFPTLPQDQATLHIDQYSGKVLADLRFKDYGWMAKMIEIGIALHEGRYFGLVNQMIGLITCLGLVMIAYSGVVMWWKRRPQRKLGTPPLPENKKTMRIVAAIMVVFGVMMPLVGLSLMIVFLVDWLIVKRIPKLQLWLS